MINRPSPRTRIGLKETFRRLDRIAGDLNVLLVVIAVGLATLDLTFLLTQKVVEHLPPVTRLPEVREPSPGFRGSFAKADGSAGPASCVLRGLAARGTSG